MNSRTLTALRGSIEKWEKIVDGSGIDEGARNCSLCEEFNIRSNDCKGCPVKEATGQPFCYNTPFDEWMHLPWWEATQRWPKGISSLPDNLQPIAREIAQKEVDFLKSLLPPPPHSQELAKMVAELDKANAPYESYRRLLSTMTKEPLRGGETLRMRVLFVIGSLLVSEQTD